MSDLRARPLKCARRPESSGSTRFCSSAEKVRMSENPAGEDCDLAMAVGRRLCCTSSRASCSVG